MAKAQALELTHDERDYLEAICRTRTIQAQIMNRARIILLKADVQRRNIMTAGDSLATD